MSFIALSLTLINVNGNVNFHLGLRKAVVCGHYVHGHTGLALPFTKLVTGFVIIRGAITFLFPIQPMQ